MRRSPKAKHSFFKILLPDFTRLLRLPQDFAKIYELPLFENVKLQINSGKTWKVKVEESNDGRHYCFTRGWSKFVREAGLKMGEFLVFKMTAWPVLRVSVFSIAGWRREIFTERFDSDSEEDGSDDDDDDYDDDDDISECSKDKVKSKRSRRGNVIKSEDKGPLYFEVCLKKHQISRITLPRRFAVATGMDRQGQHDCVMLEYLPGHRQVLAPLDQRERWRTDMRWAMFRKQNGIVVGKSYSFVFKPERNVIQVMKLAKGRPV